MSKGLAQCKVGATAYSVPVTHLVTFRPEEECPFALPTRLCSSKEMATFAYTFNPRRNCSGRKLKHCVCLADPSQVKYSGSMLKFAQWVRPFLAQLSPFARPPS